MGSLIKLVYVLIVLSIASDFINLGGDWFNSNPNGGEINARSSSMFLPGADGSVGKLLKEGYKILKSFFDKAKKQGKDKDKRGPKISKPRNRGDGEDGEDGADRADAAKDGNVTG
ncbi:hypothetical protein OS493_005305 [Desmophyllum pertusum]|uniref:Glycine-rich protein n=1 Tax=Desmophyllum pertusum TaxID=174260 RepID=A0A9W9Z4Q6_9CNID|nr:hypothetical protein OS493_005305 [Desmophyllum pertusum]